ncbi:MAG: YciI family protein [Bryobacteraceae bacterium]|nr:YciI family protein [Bryobacteraceae bacterium]
MLLVYLNEEAWGRLSETQQREAMDACAPHANQLMERGIFLSGAPLEPTATATTIRRRNGKRVVTDGPFAETREQLGGFSLIEAANLDEAIAAASGFFGDDFPAGIEIRPVVEVATLRPG